MVFLSDNPAVRRFQITLGVLAAAGVVYLAVDSRKRSKKRAQQIRLFSLLDSLTPSAQRLERIRQDLCDELVSGLGVDREEGVHQLPTYVTSPLACETATGESYGIDLGGTSYRVTKITLKNGQLDGEPIVVQGEVSKQLRTAHVDDLMDFLNQIETTRFKPEEIEEKEAAID